MRLVGMQVLVPLRRLSWFLFLLGTLVYFRCYLLHIVNTCPGLPVRSALLLLYARIKQLFICPGQILALHCWAHPLNVQRFSLTEVLVTLRFFRFEILDWFVEPCR